MTTANARKGSEAERMTARFLREQGFPAADRRLREGRADDQGDIDGVPLTVIQVKYWAAKRVQAWINDTLKQRNTAGAPLCLLVVRINHKTPACWDAYMPLGQVYPEQIFGEEMASGWIRMDLALAAALLRRKIAEMEASSPSSLPSISTGGMTPAECREWCSAPSTGSESPPSVTT